MKAHKRKHAIRRKINRLPETVFTQLRPTATIIALRSECTLSFGATAHADRSIDT